MIPVVGSKLGDLISEGNWMKESTLYEGERAGIRIAISIYQ